MVYKRFYVNILIQVLFLVVTMLAFCWSLMHPHLVVTGINLGIIIILQITYLLYYLNKINRDLARFFESIKFQDASLSFQSKKTDRVFKELYRNFNQVIHEFRNLREKLEKERFFYLNALNHIGIGLIVTNETGIILFSNKFFQKLLPSKTMKHIDSLGELKAGLPDLIRTLDNTRKELVKVVVMNEVVLLSIRCSEFRQENDLYRIISFQDIKYEIEQRELEAWQKLIRILTHEIMNSVSPITLTSAGIINMLENEGNIKDVSEIDNPAIESILTGLYAIRKRSKGLASFVEGYRSITHLPHPNFSYFSVSHMFANIEVLLNDDLNAKGIKVEKDINPENVTLYADEKLIEQVLINLLKNSISALSGIISAKIWLKAFTNGSHTFISVTDNGNGISAETLETIFVPFFTTRTEGSGIGLSLTREIMKLHSGYIKVSSDPGRETIFTLVF
jgi:two-component system, NtrC family, nitrogen regulation sensor histidine kinase NtrY